MVNFCLDAFPAFHELYRYFPAMTLTSTFRPVHAPPTVFIIICPAKKINQRSSYFGTVLNGQNS